MALQAERDFNISEKGITEILLIKPLQAMPSQAGPSVSSSQAPAPTLTLVVAAPASEKITPSAPTEKKTTAPPPPPPAPKTQLKRAAPAKKELDPTAKRQKIQQSLMAKTSCVVMKRKEEEERERRTEKEEKLQAARIKKVEDRAAKHWEEVRLIQRCLVRSAFIPFTPEEYDACATQADIDACRVMIKEMIDSRRYSPDEFDVIHKIINKRLPQFNSEMSESFNRKMKEMTERTA